MGKRRAFTTRAISNRPFGRLSHRLSAPAIVVLFLATLLTPALGSAPTAVAASQASGVGPGPVPKTPPQPGNIRTLEDGYGATQAQQQAMATASAQAKSGGKPVVVGGLTDETTQVEAEPTGGFALTTNAQPVRTLQSGTWRPIDTTLHRNHDGTYSPTATAYGTVALSGGGRGPLATTTANPSTTPCPGQVHCRPRRSPAQPRPTATCCLEWT